MPTCPVDRGDGAHHLPGLKFVVAFAMAKSAVASETPRVDATFHVDRDGVVRTTRHIDDVDVLQHLAGYLTGNQEGNLTLNNAVLIPPYFVKNRVRKITNGNSRNTSTT